MNALNVVGVCAGLLWATEGRSAEERVKIEEMDSVSAALEKDGTPRFTIATPAYTAEIGANGAVRILSGRVELIKAIHLEQNQEVRQLDAIRRDGDTLRLREGGDRAHANRLDGILIDDSGNRDAAKAPLVALPDMPGMDIRFLPDRMEITLVNLKKRAKRKAEDQPAFFTVKGLLGESAVGVKNLRTGIDDVLPARYMASPHVFAFYGFTGHYWPDMQFVYSGGAHVDVRGASGVDWGGQTPTPEDRGFWAMADVPDRHVITLRVTPSDGKGEVTPVPNFTLRPAAKKGFFFEDEPVLYHLDFPAGSAITGTWQVNWAVADHLMRPVADGRQTITLEGRTAQTADVTIKVPAMGWFSATMWLRGTNSRSAQCTREFAFARIRPEVPTARDNERWTDVIGARGLRTGVFWKDLWEKSGGPADGRVAWTNPAILAGTELVGSEKASQGTLKGEVAFLGADEPPKDLFKDKAVLPKIDEPGDDGLKRDKTVGNYVDTLEEDPQARTPAKGTPTEKTEDPRQGMMKKALHDYVAGLARAGGKLGVKHWEPINEPNGRISHEDYIETILKPQYAAVKEGNPDAIFIGGGVCGTDQHPWIRRLYELGGDKFFDDIAVHPYTAYGYQEAYRAQLDATWDILRDYKDEKARIWLTESCWHRGWGFRPYVKERFGGWQESHAKHITDLILNAEAMGIPRERIYVFFTVDHGYNDMYLIGAEWAENWPMSAAIAFQVINECLRDATFVKEEPLPGPGHHFLVFKDPARTVCAAYTCGEPVELGLLTDAQEVTVTDIMGNRRVETPQNGKFRITASGEATYLTVKAANSIRPDYSNLKVQPNLALSTLGATPSASSGTVQPWTCVNGDWTSFQSGDKWYEAPGGKDKYPDWFEVRLPKPVPVSRVRICMDYGAWEKPFKDYELQVFQGVDWKTVAAVHGNLNYDSILQHTLEPPAMTDRIRVLVHAVNACLFDSMDWIDKSSILQALEVYPVAGAAAKAFFLPEFIKPRVVPPGGSTNLIFRVRNITAAKLAGEFRVSMPAGVTADKVAQPLSVEPNGGARCGIMVKLPATVPTTMVFSVVGGFYLNGELASSDYATRIIRCPMPEPPKALAKPVEPAKEAPKAETQEPPLDAQNETKNVPTR